MLRRRKFLYLLGIASFVGASPHFYSHSQQAAGRVIGFLSSSHDALAPVRCGKPGNNPDTLLIEGLASADAALCLQPSLAPEQATPFGGGTSP